MGRGKLKEEKNPRFSDLRVRTPKFRNDFGSFYIMIQTLLKKKKKKRKERKKKYPVPTKLTF
jgi:hypothetical protein